MRGKFCFLTIIVALNIKKFWEITSINYYRSCIISMAWLWTLSQKWKWTLFQLRIEKFRKKFQIEKKNQKNCRGGSNVWISLGKYLKSTEIILWYFSFQKIWFPSVARFVPPVEHLWPWMGFRIICLLTFPTDGQVFSIYGHRWVRWN